jgi:hypothetical protein
MKDDYKIEAPADYYDRKNFWFTWPGVMIGSLGIVFFLLLFLFGNSAMVSQRPELQEIKNLLIKDGYLKNYFEFVSDVEPVANAPKSRGQALGEMFTSLKAKPKWHIENDGRKSSGYFTLDIGGWVKLSDRRPVRYHVEVFFEKEGEQPLVITKIEGYPVHYVKGEKP